MKTTDVSDSLVVRKYGVRGAKMFARLWFPWLYFLLIAVMAASWVRAPEFVTVWGRFINGSLVGGLTVLAASLLTRMRLEHLTAIKQLEGHGQAVPLRRMKTTMISLVSLLVGIGVGWYVGYSRPTAQMSREMRHQFDADESDQAAAAALATQAIQCIDSGETQKAVQFLTFPIMVYYRDYATQPGTNAQRLKVRAYIELLAQTNPVVAARLKEVGYGDTQGNIR
jgi:hypothetical protein